jgi:hypothetical protein
MSRIRLALPPRVLALAGSASLLAAAIHLQVAPEHFAEWWGYGAFFVAAAALEIGFFALLALRPGPAVLHLGIWVSLGTILMYLVSRTAGVPLGPGAGVVEPVDLLGLEACAAEAVLVVVLVARLGPAARGRTLNGLCTVGVGLWIMALAGALTPAPGAAQGHDHGATPTPSVHAHGPARLPYIPDAVRNAPRPPGIG